MTIWIDRPVWAAHGTTWAHLISDVSLAELHEFAERAGVPPRSFDADHYDVPSHRIGPLVASGARQTDAADLVRRLRGSGLRVPKHKRERLLAWEPAVIDDVPARREILISPRRVVAPRTLAIVRCADGLLLNGGGPPQVEPGNHAQLGAFDVAQAQPVGRQRIRPQHGSGAAARGRIEIAFIGAVLPGPVREQHGQPLPGGVHWAEVGAARQRCGDPLWWVLVDRLPDVQAAPGPTPGRPRG